MSFNTWCKSEHYTLSDSVLLGSGCNAHAHHEGNHSAATLAHRTPFTLAPPVFAAKCEPGKKALAGALVIEKLTPMPPGSAVPFYASQLGEPDPIDQKMQLRVSACDEGAYAGRSTEVTF